MTATIYELNKSGILNNAVGIDSIMVSNLPISVKLNNVTIAELTTDAAGKAVLDRSWSELGLSSPAVGNALNLEWSGSHKGQSFAKVALVQVK